MLGNLKAVSHARGVQVAGDYLPRRAAELIGDALDDTRVVVVTGAKQISKSTSPSLRSVSTLAAPLIYCGIQQLSFGEALSCLPFSALWTAHKPA